MRRGRKSQAERDMEPLMVHSEPVPVQPPVTLSDPARKIFLELVASCDPAHFEDADVGILAQFCEAQALAERAAQELQKESPPNPRWLPAWKEGTKTMKDLALRLRLSPQSRREKAKVKRPLTWDENFRLEKFGRL